MKRYMWLSLIAVILFLGATQPATADTFTFALQDLFSPHFINQSTGGVTETGRTLNSSSVTYNFTASGTDSVIQIGDGFDWDDEGFNKHAGFNNCTMPNCEDYPAVLDTMGGPLGDLSGFDSYGLLFTNTNDEPIWVNLYMNTGDNRLEAYADSFYQVYQDENGYSWYWLDAGASIELILDFASADQYHWTGTDTVHTADTAVDNLDEVSNIGFMVAFGSYDADGNFIFGTGSGDYSLEVASLPGVEIPDYCEPVPVPGALWLLGSGLMGLIGLRRRFRK